MSLRVHRVEDAVTDAVVCVLRASARRVLVSALATVWATWTQWRTWTWNAGSHPDEAVEHHFYWPACEWSHTDFVAGPSSLGLVLTFLIGVALWYLSVSVVDASLQLLGQRIGIRQRFRTVAPSVGRNAWWLDNRWHPIGLVALVAFSLLASLLPPQSPFSLFTHPGIVTLLDIAGHLGTECYLTDRMVGLVVPVSYL